VRLTICILSLHCFDQKAYALAEIAGANGTIAAANVSAAIPARVFERMSAMIFLRRLCGAGPRGNATLPGAARSLGCRWASHSLRRNTDGHSAPRACGAALHPTQFVRHEPSPAVIRADERRRTKRSDRS